MARINFSFGEFHFFTLSNQGPRGGGAPPPPPMVVSRSNTSSQPPMQGQQTGLIGQQTAFDKNRRANHAPAAAPLFVPEAAAAAVQQSGHLDSKFGTGKAKFLCTQHLQLNPHKPSCLRIDDYQGWQRGGGGQAPTVPNKNLLRCSMLRHASSRRWGGTQIFQTLKLNPNLRVAGTGTIWLFLVVIQNMVLQDGTL